MNKKLWSFRTICYIITVFLILLSGSLYRTSDSASAFDSPHGNYDLSAWGCAACHTAHTSKSAYIISQSSNKQACYNCHDGSNSIFNIRGEFGEETIGSSVYSSYHPVPTNAQDCMNCHDPHLTASSTPKLVSVGPSKTSSGNAVCGYCHGDGSGLLGGDIITPFTGTAHDTATTNPSSGTQIKCSRCHQPHGSPYTDLIRTAILDQTGVSHTVTGNNNTACFGCHTDTTGNYFGGAIYEQTKHGPGTTTITETSQSDFSAGTLTNVASLPGGELTLAGNPGLSFDGIDDRVNLTSGYTTTQNSFTYEFWMKPTATHEIDTQSNSSTAGTSGQRYAIGAQSGGSGGLAGMGVSVGTNGVTVYEHADSYMPPLLVYSGSLNNWVHVAVVYNNKIPSLYINGQLIKTGLTSQKTPFPSNTFGYGSYGYFAGYMNNIRLWNYVRTQTEIQNDMYKQLAGNEGGLIGYWKLDEGSGTTASDSAATNNGTVTGAVWGQYVASGNRVSPEHSLPAVTSSGSQIAWNSAIPSNVTMTVETNVFLGGVWQGWQSATNSGSIPGITNGTDLTGGKIQYRVNMSTANTSLSPHLQDVSLRFTYNSTVSKSVYTGTSYLPSQCMNCHEPHGKTGVSFYRRAEGNTLCITCHDDPANVRPANYSYKGITTYNGTPHGSMDPIPNPALYTNPVMSPGYCVICHNPHGKNDGVGTAIPKQLQLSQDQLCFGGGSGCHSDSANSTLGISIQNRFTAGSNATARHSISPQEQAAENTKVQCVNCHDPHLNTATNKIVDPDNRYDIYNGLDQSIFDYISDTGEVYMMVKAKHDGNPPTFTSGPSLSNITETSCKVNWSTNELTTGIVEWGPTPDLGNTINSSIKTSHSVTLSGFTLFQNYYYKVKAIDALGNFTETAVKAVDSTPPSITSGPSVANATETSTDIIWLTNEASTSYVDYNTSANYAVYGYEYTAGTDTRVTSHSVYLSGLEPGVEYTYRARSMDARGNETQSADSIYRLSASPSVPTNLTYNDPSPGVDTSTITLNWSASTDPDGDPIRYYVQTSYDSAFTSIINQGYTNYGVTSWQVTVTNQDTVTYYWRVKAVDEGGAESAYASSTFAHTGTATVVSCPILYTWEGEKFQYNTDLVAGSNVGLEMSPGKYLKPAPDEQVAIPGELLKEKNGHYIIKIKNEQNEVDFIDNLILQAVDHPIGTKIALNDFTRAKEDYKIYTYSQDLKPVNRAAFIKNPTWSGGEISSPVDVTELLNKVDNKHVIGTLFNDDQYELDLGDLSNAKEIKLIVTGWTEFAKSDEREMRVKKETEGIKTAPRLLEILQPDGSWKTEKIKQIPGYTKTMVIDLNGKFPEGTKKFMVRLRGLYRPHIDFIGVDTTKQANIKVVDLEMVKATLAYHQPSKYTMLPSPYFEYENKRSYNLWIHEGKFTKYGNVLPLTDAIDDKLVVMDTGDELTVSFKALPPPSPGMTRSFVLKPWAYYKELSEAKTEPMPFRAMDLSKYPQSLGDYPEELKKYVEEWNTRVHKAGKLDDLGFHERVKEFFVKILNALRELWKSAFASESAENVDSSQTKSYSGNQGLAQLPVKLEDHYSLNTDYVVLHTDNTVISTEYTMNSAGSGMWESGTQPIPNSPGTDGLANKSKVTSSNNDRWITDYYNTPNQGNGEFNYQMYKFVVTNPLENVSAIRVSWEGYGEPTTGYNVSLNLWNFTESRWDQFYDQLVGTEKNLALLKSKDYKPYCLKCHDGTPPVGVQLGPYTRNISSSYTGDYHGGLSGTDDTGSTIKPGYSRGVTLPCADCHDLHGSQNAYHLRENVNRTTGISVPSMTVTGEFDMSKNAATLTYCQSCHAGTLDDFHWTKCLSCHRDPGAHDCSPPTAASFSRACAHCHTHGGYMPAHGECHCTLDSNAKAF